MVCNIFYFIVCFILKITIWIPTTFLLLRTLIYIHSLGHGTDFFSREKLKRLKKNKSCTLRFFSHIYIRYLEIVKAPYCLSLRKAITQSENTFYKSIFE